ncbi:hypothetical protein [Vibrio anguillarum]|uniref:hypothetical protein n=1 Tax=Vibrio anguillarum TaxID=55601 RepID=UPI00030C3227|nr:hypothetical protein [Vibrio anguillarum]
MNSRAFIIVTAILIPLVLFLISPVYSSLFSSEKSLSYALMHTKDLTEDYKEGDSWSKLSTSFDGIELKSAYLSRILIVNSGNKPISRNDFDSDVIIKMGQEIDILGVRVEESSPFNLDIDHYFKEDEVNFKGLLLNPNDQFILEVLSKERPEIISVQSRIAGIDKPRQVDYQKSDGLYLKRVKHESVAVSQETTLIKFNTYLISVVSLISIFSSLISIRSFENKRGIIYASLYIPYILSLLVSIVMMDSLLKDLGLETTLLRAGVLTLVLSMLVFASDFIVKKKGLKTLVSE